MPMQVADTDIFKVRLHAVIALIVVPELLSITRVHNIIEEESIILYISLYKRVLQSISAFHRLLQDIRV